MNFNGGIHFDINLNKNKKQKSKPLILPQKKSKARRSPRANEKGSDQEDEVDINEEMREEERKAVTEREDKYQQQKLKWDKKKLSELQEIESLMVALERRRVQIQNQRDPWTPIDSPEKSPEKSS